MQDPNEKAEISVTPAGTMSEEGPNLNLRWTTVHTVRRKAAKRSEEWYRNGAGPLLIPARKKRRIEEPPLPLPAATDEVEISECLPSPAATPPSTDTVHELTQSPSQTQLKPIEMRETQLDGDDDERVFVPGALHDAPEMLASPNTSYEEREKELRDNLSSGKKVVKRIISDLSSKKHGVKVRSLEQKTIRKEKDKITAKAYGAAGMTTAGYVKRGTNVFFDELPKDSAFHSHPIFHGIPYTAPRYGVQLAWLQELRSLEHEVLAIKAGKPSTPHRYDANQSYQVGISVVAGGEYGKGVSGSIHSAASPVKDRPELRRRITECFKKILGALYGKAGWYKRLLLITTQLNCHTNERRTIPGLPLSGLLLTENPNEESIHCDRNVVGATFLLTTSDVTPTLCLSSPTQKLAKYDLKPGTILAGSWANYAHCKSKVDEVDEHPGNSRTSWRLYLDERVFCTKYKYMDP
jgi:hypothetical protein